MEIGFSNPPNCLKTTCTTDGFYSSLGTCERIEYISILLNFFQKLVLQVVRLVRILQLVNHAALEIISIAQQLVLNVQKENMLPHQQLARVKRFIFITLNLLDCPPGCSSCIDAQTCTSCNSGLALSQNYCLPCPTGTYLTSDQLCKGIIIHH